MEGPTKMAVMGSLEREPRFVISEVHGEEGVRVQTRGGEEVTLSRDDANMLRRFLHSPADYRTPSLSLLVKLGSIARHADELTSPTGRGVDSATIRSLLDDPEVSEWMAQLDDLGLLPVKR